MMRPAMIGIILTGSAIAGALIFFLTKEVWVGARVVADAEDIDTVAQEDRTCEEQIAAGTISLSVLDRDEVSGKKLSASDRAFSFSFDDSVDDSCVGQYVTWFLVYGREENPTHDDQHYWYTKSGRYTFPTVVEDLESGIWHFRACAETWNGENNGATTGECVYSDDLSVVIP